jgi:hypothetical protein
MAALAARRLGTDAAWFTLLGTPPLREVMDKALGLPQGFRGLDVDRQLAVYSDRARAVFGISAPADLSDPALRRKVIETFLLRDGLDVTVRSPGSTALQLLRARL